MKQSRFFKKGIAIWLSSCFVANLILPLALEASEHTTTLMKAAFVAKKNNYIDVSPQLLDGFDLNKVLHEIIMHAQDKGMLEELPQGLIRCYESLKTGVYVHKADLQAAMPFIIQAVVPADMIDADGNIRAPRPEPEQGAPIVGAATSDLTQVLQAISCLRALITQDFNQTWTMIQNCCDQIAEDFNDTWTILSHLNFNVTATTDVSTVFTALNACCTQTQKDFAQTWTILAHLDRTITATTDLSTVFTALNACCAQTQKDFQQTWTILNHLNFNVTATVDLSGVYSSLNKVDKEFQQTWTMIQNQQNLMQKDFTRTWTILNKIDNDVLTCCAQTQKDFTQTWTILAHLDRTITATTDLSTVFTALNACCRQTQKDFAQTWTILSHLNFNATATVDLSGVYTSLNKTTKEFQQTWTMIQNCCAQTQRDFNQTWTILADLAPCGATPLFNTPSGNVTISVPGIYCLAQDITGTITIAASHVTIDLNGYTIGAVTATSQNDIVIKNGVVIGGGGIFTGINLNACTNVMFDYVDTATVAQAVSATNSSLLVFKNMSCRAHTTGVMSLSTVTSSMFKNILIENNNVGTGGTLVAISGSSNNCTFDTLLINNNTALTGLSTNGGSSYVFNNCYINGNAVNSSSTFAAWSISGSKDIVMTNCSANENSNTGTGNVEAIVIANSQNLLARNIQTDFNSTSTASATTYGLYLQNNGGPCKNMEFTTGQSSFNSGGTTFGVSIDSGAQNIVLNDYAANNNTATVAPFNGAGFSINSASNITCTDCAANNNSVQSPWSINVSNSLAFTRCQSNGNSIASSTSLFGWFMNSSGNIIMNGCTANENTNTGSGPVTGMLVGGGSQRVNFTACQTNKNSATTAFSVSGLILTSVRDIVINNFNANGNSNNGVGNVQAMQIILGSNVQASNIQTNFNSSAATTYGLYLQSASPNVGKNISFEHGQSSFNSGSTTYGVYIDAGSQNISCTDYVVNNNSATTLAGAAFSINSSSNITCTNCLANNNSLLNPWSVSSSSSLNFTSCESNGTSVSNAAALAAWSISASKDIVMNSCTANENSNTGSGNVEALVIGSSQNIQASNIQTNYNSSSGAAASTYGLYLQALPGSPGCQNVEFTTCQSSFNAGATVYGVYLDIASRNIVFNDYMANRNTATSAALTGAAFSINASTNVTCNRCIGNNNTMLNPWFVNNSSSLNFTNCESNGASVNSTNTFTGWSITNSKDIVMNTCSTNENSNINTGNVEGIVVANSQNLQAKNIQANYNSSVEAVYGLYLQNSGGACQTMEFTTCQSSFNSGAVAYGVYIDNGSDNIVLNDYAANSNTAAGAFNGAAFYINGSTNVTCNGCTGNNNTILNPWFVNNSSSLNFINCQSNGTSLNSLANPLRAWIINNSQDVVMNGCTTNENSNSGSGGAAGITIISTNNLQASGIQTNYNSSQGTTQGLVLSSSNGEVPAPNNIYVTDGQSAFNSGTTTYGVYVDVGSENITFNEYAANNNSSTTLAGAAFSINSATNVTCNACTSNNSSFLTPWSVSGSSSLNFTNCQSNGTSVSNAGALTPWSIAGSKDIVMNNCSANENSNTGAGNVQAITIANSKNLQAHDIQANNNNSSATTLGFYVQNSGGPCINMAFNNCDASFNSSSLSAYGFYLDTNANNIQLTSCSANKNNALGGSAFFMSSASGITCTDCIANSNNNLPNIWFASNSNTISFKNCQASDTTGNNPLNPVIWLILNSNNITLDDCSIINNVNSTANGNLEGLEINSCQDVTLSECLFNGNSCPLTMYGVRTILSSKDIKFNACQACDNRSTTASINANGIAVGFNANTANNLTYIGCIANNNTTPNGNTSGVARGFDSTSVNDNSFINCIANENTTGGAGYGFEVTTQNNTTISDCIALANGTTDGAGMQGNSCNQLIVEKSISEGNQSGILVSACTVGSITSNKVASNGGNGINIINNSTQLFVENNFIQNNTVFGINVAGSVNNVFLSNQAQAGGGGGANNYNGVPLGTIATFNPTTGAVGASTTPVPLCNLSVILP